MAMVSVIKLSELKGAKRIDADRYHVKFLGLDNNLRKISPIRELRSLIVEPVRTGHTPRDRDVYEEDERIYFVKTDTLREGLVNFEKSDFLPARSLSEAHYLRPNDVIVTIIGAHFNIIGRAAIFLHHYPQTVVNQNIVVIKPDENIINPFYLMVFLNSKYGREQLWMLSRQTEQVNLNCREVEGILVPIFDTDFQKEIELLTKKSSKAAEKSKSLYTQAENLLLKELRLEDFQPKYELSYTANLSKAFGVHRIDAEYYQPVYHKLGEYLRRNFKTKPLEMFLLDFQKGIEVGSENYQEEGKPFIRVSNLSTHGFVKKDQKYIDEELYKQLKDIYGLNTGNFLLTKDATPGMAYVVRDSVEGIIASGILKLNLNESQINKEYLALCINSMIGKLQIERDVGGSVIIHWRPEQIKKLQIPILPDEMQQKVASLVQKSHKARKKAKELLEEAKRKVEEIIEYNIEV